MFHLIKKYFRSKLKTVLCGNDKNKHLPQIAGNPKFRSTRNTLSVETIVEKQKVHSEYSNFSGLELNGQLLRKTLMRTVDEHGAFIGRRRFENARGSKHGRFQNFLERISQFPICTTYCSTHFRNNRVQIFRGKNI